MSAPSGKIIGVEISPDSAKNVRNRAEINEWKNVKAIESNALEVRLTASFDARLMFAAADNYASNLTLENIVPHLKENARVVAFGAKFSRHRFGRLLNPVSKTLFKLSCTTTPKPDREPWQIMSKDLRSESISLV